MKGLADDIHLRGFKAELCSSPRPHKRVACRGVFASCAERQLAEQRLEERKVEIEAQIRELEERLSLRKGDAALAAQQGEAASGRLIKGDAAGAAQSNGDNAGERSTEGGEE